MSSLFQTLPFSPRSTLFPYTTLFRSCLRARSLSRNRRLLQPSGLGVPSHGGWLGGHRRLDSPGKQPVGTFGGRSEEHTSELQSHVNLVCRLLLEKKKYIIAHILQYYN